MDTELDIIKELNELAEIGRKYTEIKLRALAKSWENTTNWEEAIKSTNSLMNGMNSISYIYYV